MELARLISKSKDQQRNPTMVFKFLFRSETLRRNFASVHISLAKVCCTKKGNGIGKEIIIIVCSLGWEREKIVWNNGTI